MVDFEKHQNPSSREVLGALSGACFVAALLQWLLEWVSRFHWAAGAVVGAAAAAGVVWLSFMAKRGLGRTPTGYVTVALSFGTVSLAAIGGWVSFTLYSVGLADYAVKGAYSTDTFVRLYLYTLVDLLPAVGVWETLHIDPPAEPKNAWAGVPLVAFRVFVIGLVLDTYKAWRKMRDTKSPQK